MLKIYNGKWVNFFHKLKTKRVPFYRVVLGNSHKQLKFRGLKKIICKFFSEKA